MKTRRVRSKPLTASSSTNNSLDSINSVFSQALSLLTSSSGNVKNGRRHQGDDEDEQDEEDEDEEEEDDETRPRPHKRIQSTRIQHRQHRRQRRKEQQHVEREARAVAIEKAYVHDVYEEIAPVHAESSTLRGGWPRVNRFLLDLEPGSLVGDAGCGCGKYLDVNPSVFVVGAERCKSLSKFAASKSQVVLCDHLALPFRDASLDAVVSVAVIHHVANVERRIRAIRELARVLRVGGRVIITVWAMEQRHRKFESQDVLIPWQRPSSLATATTAEMATSTTATATTTTTTTTASEDDSHAQHYHAYSRTATTTSDSNPEQASSSSVDLPRRRKMQGGIPLPLSSRRLQHSGSELSSPNESCYSFVRRAFQVNSG